MSGHSKWSTIKRKKGANDAKRGKMFTKLIREITVAARDGGADESSNVRLRSAVQNARAANMPLSTVERAVKRGSGQEEGTSYEEGLYEGYGPGGVAIMVETLTDNKNRTVSEVRHIFSKHGGNLAHTNFDSSNLLVPKFWYYCFAAYLDRLFLILCVFFLF